MNNKLIQMRENRTVQSFLCMILVLLFLSCNKAETITDAEDTEESVTSNTNWKFTMDQTLSSGAQINTIAFSGLAFYSGSFYASTFLPPGKIADYFGFQFMRDNDLTESGHNTDFLTKAAWHTMAILNSAQLQKLIDLAAEQEQLYEEYALGRLVLIKAFHRYLDGDLPSGTSKISLAQIQKVSADLYEIDGNISYRRAVVFSEVIKSLTSEQAASFKALGNSGMQEWTMPERPTVEIPKGLNTWVMSNASEMFSWYLRDITADIYFCPERQGTYFGGFFMKDAPAVGNAGYAIDPQATAEKGAKMLNEVLTNTQSDIIKSIYPSVTDALNKIVEIRTSLAKELRKERSTTGEQSDKETILSLSREYGEYDGIYIYQMVENFVKVGRTLSTEQKNALKVLRDLDNYPDEPGKVFIYSEKRDLPEIPNTDFLFE